jgi:hypothetical protein
MNNGLIINIGETGKSEAITDLYEIYKEKIKSFLTSRTYEQFGDGDEKVDLHLYTFKNIDNNLKISLQTRIRSLIMNRFPEIEPESVILNNVKGEDGVIGFTLSFRLLEEDLEVEI